MHILRIIFYMIGIVGSISVALRCFTFHHKLAKMIGFVMLAWAVGTFSAMVSAIAFVITGSYPTWMPTIMYGTSILLAVTPWAFYVFIGRITK